MTKKKLVSLCLVLALVLTAVVGGTMAYFTDKDAELNTFTVGKVDIELVEDFEDGSELMPGQTVKKEAKIVNNGPNDAWVWAEILIPASLDDNDDNSPAAPGLGNSLHFNFPGAYSVEYANTADKWANTDGKLWIQQHNADGVSYGYMGTETVGNVTYNKFVALYTEKLGEGEETSLFLNKVYMDNKVEQCTTAGHAANCLVLADKTTHYTGTWELIVRAYAIQDGAEFTSVVDAWKAYDGETPVAE